MLSFKLKELLVVCLRLKNMIANRIEGKKEKGNLLSLMSLVLFHDRLGDNHHNKFV